MARLSTIGGGTEPKTTPRPRFTRETGSRNRGRPHFWTVGNIKTFVAIDMAAAVITETPFLGFPVVRRGGVLFFAMEGQNEVTKRTIAALAARGHTDKLAPFAWIDTCPRLLDPAASDETAVMVAAAAGHMQREFDLPVALVIVDTAGKAAGFTKMGEENDAALNKVLMKNLAASSQKTGAFFFAVDHFGKDISPRQPAGGARRVFVAGRRFRVGDDTTSSDASLCSKGVRAERAKLPGFALAGELYEHPMQGLPRRLNHFAVVEVAGAQINRGNCSPLWADC